MMNYRFPLILAVCLTYLGLAPNHHRHPRVELKSLGSSLNFTDTKVLAQTPPADTAASSTYDSYMRAGYVATDKRDYATALDNFQKALSLRPGDSYAQGAIANIKTYQQKSRGNFEFPWLWLALGAIVVALVGLFVALVVSSRQQQRQLPTTKRESLPPQVPETNFPPGEAASAGATSAALEVASKNRSQAESETKDESGRELPIQQTTRLPNLDVIEELIQQLHTSDPKHRRKVIWELAQRADSRAIKPLVDLMIDSDSRERSLILEALSQISTRTLKPLNHALALSLQDESAQVRQNAIRDLTKIYDLMFQVSKLLSHATADPDPEVQETAEWALKQLTQLTPIPESPKIDSVAKEQEQSNSANDAQPQK